MLRLLRVTLELLPRIHRIHQATRSRNHRDIKLFLQVGSSKARCFITAVSAVLVLNVECQKQYSLYAQVASLHSQSALLTYVVLGQPPTTHQHVPVRNVVVNSRKLSDMEVTDLQNTLRFPIVDGEVRFSLDYLVLHAIKSLLSHVALSGLHSLAAKSLLPLPRAIFTSLSNILH